MECPALKELIIQFLTEYIYKRPNVFNFGRILNINNTITLVNLLQFNKCGLDMYTHFICNKYLLFVQHSVLYIWLYLLS